MENAKKYIYESCDFKCFKKSNYDAHLATRKHEILTNPNKENAKEYVTEFKCECGKKYKHHHLREHKTYSHFIEQELHRTKNYFELRRTRKTFRQLNINL